MISAFLFLKQAFRILASHLPNQCDGLLGDALITHITLISHGKRLRGAARI
jgi:hypothetical protein